MDPTVSFVLALVALVIAGLSAIASFLAIRQNASHFPRPILHGELDFRKADDGTHGWMRFHIRNMGNAEAEDVVFSLMNGEEQIGVSFFATLAPRAEEYYKWRISDDDVSVEMPGGSLIRTGPGIHDPLKLRVEVGWRQVPNLARPRQKTFHAVTTTHLD